MRTRATARRNQRPVCDARLGRSGTAQIVDANLLAPSGVRRAALIGAKAVLGWTPVADRETFIAGVLAVHAPRAGMMAP